MIKTIVPQAVNTPATSPKSTAIYAIHTDHLGTPQAITDDKQTVVWRADYATFGKATVQARVVDGSSRTAKTSFGIISTANAATTTAKPFEFNLRFAGQYEDTESGYHYNWHRYYDPSTGRYLTPDPIGLAGGLNGYGYAGQDPMGAVDPWGLYRMVMGFEVNNPAAFAGGVHNLSVDYGHAFFYLVDDNNKITDVFSHGPTQTPGPITSLTGVPATANYGLDSSNVNLFPFDISKAEYEKLQNEIKKFGTPSYWIAGNRTCASSAMDILGKVGSVAGGLPAGKSDVVIYNKNILGVPVKVTLGIDVVNPYALYNGLHNLGLNEYYVNTATLTGTQPDGSYYKIKTGITDPTTTQPKK
jgi:RHS repeat-associated protein